MKLSKQKIKSHEQAVDYLKKDNLSFDEKIFVLENWNESAEHINSKAGAFFTPTGLAKDFSLEVMENANIVDMCAGIGKLAFFAYHFKNCKVTCVEINTQYYEVGKKILPEANWINDSIFNISDELFFDQSISNPPFGNIKTGIDTTKHLYKGSEFEFLVIEKASKISKYGTFILPQQSTPFRYSGKRYKEPDDRTNKLIKFENETGLVFEMNCGIDTGYYIDDWNGVSPMCEIVNFDFDNKKQPYDDLKIENQKFNYSEGSFQATLF